ncbi:hypothetical protein [Shimia ponticola]|uniref:hypothetical protein n=1 Tax=Shimia ponticola TaxID=2582893 RepID=UPI00164C3A8E|nr:hypothetical protein [Shimia ponticola]
MAISEGSEAARLMRLPVNHPDITWKMRCWRECAAMMSHYLARGIGPGYEHGDEIEAKSAVLETTVDNLDKISREELLALHELLADAIKPALPKSIELFHHDAQNSRMNWLAPVGAIRTLVGITFGAIVILIAVMTTEDFGQHYYKRLLSQPETNTLFSLIFYVCLAALGACFSVLYDARRYVVDGTYDPRVGSNYPIRILLGIMSGVILSQLLFDSLGGSFGPQVPGTAEEIENSRIGRPLTALLGGFSGQFVYTGLQKLVDSLTLVFSPAPEDRLAEQERMLRAEMAETNAAKDAERAVKGAKLATELATHRNNPDRAAEIVDQILSVAVGQQGLKSSFVTDESTDSILGRARSVLSLGEVMLDVLPDGETTRIRGGISAITQRIADVEALLDKARSSEAAAIARDLKGILDGDEPVKQTLMTSARALIGPAQALGLISNPAGIALSLLLAGGGLVGPARDRLQTLILNRRYTPQMLPPALVNENTVLLALQDPNNAAFATLLIDAGLDTTNNAGLSDLGVAITAGDDDALYARFGGNAEREAFDDGLNTLRGSILASIVEVDLPPDALEAAGADSPSKLMRVIDALRGTPESESALHRIFILTDFIRETRNKPAEGLVKSIFKRIAEEALT